MIPVGLRVFVVAMALSAAACTGHSKPPAAGKATSPTTASRHVTAVVDSDRNGISIHADILDRSPELAFHAAQLVKASKFEVSQGRTPVPTRCFPADSIQGKVRVGDGSHSFGSSRPRQATETISSVSGNSWLLPGARSLVFFTAASVFDVNIVSVRYVLDGTVRDEARPTSGWVVLATILRGREALPPWYDKGSVEGLSQTGQVIATVSLPHDNGFRWC